MNTLILSTDLTLDTSAYTSGDTLSDKVTLGLEPFITNMPIVIQDITVVDIDAQSADFDILFFGDDFTLTGTKNNAFAVTDADMKKCDGVVSVVAADYVDCNLAHVANIRNLSIGFKPVDAGSRNLYIATISRGTPTHTAAGIRLKITCFQD